MNVLVHPHAVVLGTRTEVLHLCKAVFSSTLLLAVLSSFLLQTELVPLCAAGLDTTVLIAVLSVLLLPGTLVVSSRLWTEVIYLCTTGLEPWNGSCLCVASG